MRTVRLLMLGVLVLLAGAVRADDELELDPPHITVYGTAITEITPDRMVWLLAVRNEAPTLQEAAEIQARSVQEVLALLAARGIAERTVETARTELAEVHGARTSFRSRSGYAASTGISFGCSDFSQYEALWTGLAKIQHVSVRSVLYDHSRRAELENETRKQAVLAAKEQALSLVGTLGAKLGAPLLVEEHPRLNEGWGQPVTLGDIGKIRDEAHRSGDILAPGKIAIRIRVKVIFGLAQ